jgi:hypothetical protein
VFAIFVLGYLDARAWRIWTQNQTRYKPKQKTPDGNQSDWNGALLSLPFSRESFAKDKNAGGHALA